MNMAFLDELRRYLERPEVPDPVYVPELSAHRKHLLDILQAIEKDCTTPRQTRQLEADHRFWSANLDRFAEQMGAGLIAGLAHGATRDEITKLIDIAVSRELGIPASSGSRVKDMEIDRLRKRARRAMEEVRRQGAEELRDYALDIRAVRRTGNGRASTPIGRLILELPDRDAVRWMLANEVVQSQGPEDERRLSSAMAQALFKSPSGHLDWLGSEPWLIPWGILDRLAKLGLLTVTEDEDNQVTSYRLLSGGRSALEELASGKETPFTLLSRAILQDETHAVVSEAQLGAALAPAESSTAATARHARMVAHEIRNALVPIQGAVEALYRDVERADAGEALVQRRDAIDSGIARIFRFLRDISRIADLAVAPSDLFDPASAVEDAIAAVRADLGRAIPFEQSAVLPAVRGHRDRFVLAVVNLLRNAAQARVDGTPEIRVSAGVHNGSAVFIAVDDDGPGVPEEHRATVFEPGFSLRADGSGQGLALVREVVEAEMLGRATCEESPLGGARFLIKLPVGARRQG
jgi:signal transduction histidine kinase